MGTFDVQAFECPSGFVYLALVHGDVSGQTGVLTRLHSECLTGDALGSLRCDCGVQLRLALRTIAAAECGVLIYATAGGQAVDPEEVAAWSASDEGREFMTRSSHGWRDASIAAGTDPEAAEAAAARTTAAYTGA